MADPLDPAPPDPTGFLPGTDAGDGPATDPGWRVPGLLIGLVLLLFLWPVVLGQETLFFRDVANFHWPAQAWRALQGSPSTMVDLWRNGGQFGLGNPNTLALHPTSWLLAGAASAGQALWVFNAHFWVHLLLAPFAFRALARELDAGPVASWLGAALYLGNGFVLSTLGFFNLVAVSALAPLLAWSMLRATAADSRARGTAGVVTGVAWALLLTAGDPPSAVLALGAAAVCVLARGRSRRGGVAATAAALSAGTLIAWPQLSGLVIGLAGSARATLGFSAEGVLRGSWHPALVLDQLVPFLLGRPDPTFSGHRFHGGAQPLFYTFFPGVLALVVVLAGLVLRLRDRGRVRVGAAERAGWLLLVGGVFVGLGSFNPLVAWLAALAPTSLLRFPVKAWWWVAMGVGLLGADVLRRCLGPERSSRRVLVVVASVVGLLQAGILAATFLASAREELAEWIGGPDPGLAVAAGLAGVRLATGVGLVVLALLLILARRRRGADATGWRVLLTVHLAAQMLLLAALGPTLPSSGMIREAPALAGLEPGESLLVHGSVGGGFPPAPPPSGRSTAQLQESLLASGAPAAGAPRGFRYLLDASPEGLDSYLPGLVRGVLPRLGEAQRVRLLAATGATHLLTQRPVAGVAGLVEEAGSGGDDAWFRYRLTEGRPVFLSTDRRPARDAATALGAMLAEDFDPGSSVTVPEGLPDGIPASAHGGGEPGETSTARAGAAVEWTSPDRVRVALTAPTGGVLVLDRAYLDGYRATVDGEAAPTMPVNVSRLGVPVPPGASRVEVFFDRRWWGETLGISLAGWLGLVLLLVVGRHRGGGAPSPTAPLQSPDPR